MYRSSATRVFGRSLLLPNYKHSTTRLAHRIVPRPSPPPPRSGADLGKANIAFWFRRKTPDVSGSGDTVQSVSDAKPSWSDNYDNIIQAVAGVTFLFFGGIVYVKWYKANVLNKIEEAFEPGYDPALHLASHADPSNWASHLRRKEQELVEKFIKGEDPAHYYLLLGSKGTGKTTMMLDAMKRIDADGVAICEAHADLEVFRLRLGKALNFEYNEDSQTGLFQRRDPREGGPRLDIERALNKLEKVAIRLHEKRKKPLVLIFNNMHVLRNNEDAQFLILQLQQRAESWAESGLVTVVFSTDDFWPYPLLRKHGNRMQILSIYDLDRKEALTALKQLRKDLRKDKSVDIEPDSILHQVLDMTGGRLSILSRVARSPDMVARAQELVRRETGWLQSLVGLIPDCDDDVMDEQKVSSCTWLLLREFVRKRREDEEIYRQAREAGEDLGEVPIPHIPYVKCRQIMTRADFLEFLDNQNIIAIDIDHNVAPDSMLILKAAIQVVEEPGFDEMLDSVRDRIDAIESLHRTRELVWKDSPEGEGDRVRILLETAKPEAEKDS